MMAARSSAETGGNSNAPLPARSFLEIEDLGPPILRTAGSAEASFSRSRDETRTTRQPACSTMVPTWAAGKSVRIGTATAPIDVTAKYAMPQAGLFSPRMATRSPACTPREASREAVPRARLQQGAVPDRLSAEESERRSVGETGRTRQQNFLEGADRGA